MRNVKDEQNVAAAWHQVEGSRRTRQKKARAFEQLSTSTEQTT